MKSLLNLLKQLDNAPFGKLKGRLRTGRTWQHQDFTLQFEHIQGSPGADPASVAKVSVSNSVAGFPRRCFASSASQLALSDFLIRRFGNAIDRFARQNRGRDRMAL
jgi:hypothetical protein